MVKMGWTADPDLLPPVFTDVNRSYNSEKRSGFGFVKEENRKLDFEVILSERYNISRVLNQSTDS